MVYSICNSVQKDKAFNRKLTFFRGYATQHIFTGLKTLTQYTYCVRLLNDAGFGPWSCAVTVTTDSKHKLHTIIL